MKTLDEVIENLGRVEPASRYGDVQIMVEDLTDALQWLKGYKGHIELDKLRDKCEAENDPFTWDELKQMVGKPVWVEMTFPEGSYYHWGIIKGFTKAGYEFMVLEGFHVIRQFSVMEKEMGKTWQAYRKERG